MKSRDNDDVALGLGVGYFQRAEFVACFVRDAQQVGAGGDGCDEVFFDRRTLQSSTRQNLQMLSVGSSPQTL